MNLSTAILGAGVVKHLQAQRAAGVLQIGKDVLTRADLARVGCYNFTAARILSRVLNEALQVAGLRDVFERVAPADLVLPGLGAVSLAVLGAAFEAKKIGGGAPLESYLNRHKIPIATFDTMKARARANTNGHKPATRKR